METASHVVGRSLHVGLGTAGERRRLGAASSYTKSFVILCGTKEGTAAATNLGIDEKLLEEAHRLGGHRTKKATVNEALKEFIGRRRQLKILDLFGEIDYDPEYDYKEQRRRR